MPPLHADKLKFFLAGAIIQATTIVIIYIYYQSVVNSPSAGELASLGASIGSAIAYVPTFFLIAFAVTWLVLRNRWLLFALIYACSQLATAMIINSANTDRWWFYPSLIIISGAVFVSLRVISQLKVSPLRKYMYMLLLAFAINAILVVPVYIANKIATSRQNTVSTKALSDSLAKLDFTIYEPTTLPAGYSVSNIVPADENEVTILHAPRYLNFKIKKDVSGDYPVEIKEFKKPADFMPPQTCGPFNANTLEVGPAQYLITCTEITRIGKIIVYYTKEPESPPRYNYYFIEGDTEIAMTAQDVWLSPQDLTNIISGMRATTTSNLPSALISQY